jgi:hypothetical protein
MDGELLTKIFFGGLSGFLLMWLGPKIMRIMKFNNSDPGKPKLISEPLNNKVMAENDTFLEQKKTLSDLKNANVLTETEYNEKLQILERNEENLIQKKILEQIDIQTKGEIEPLVTKLNKLLTSGVISNEEFEAKKGKLYSDRKQYLISNPYQEIDFIDLIADQKLVLKDILINRKEEKTYWVKKRSNVIFSFSKNEVISLRMSNSIKDYIFIKLPLLGSNQLVFDEEVLNRKVEEKNSPDKSNHEVIESGKVKYFWGQRDELKIKFMDGKIGKLLFSNSLKKYYFKDGIWTVYYIDEASALAGLHYYLCNRKVLNEGRYYYM